MRERHHSIRRLAVLATAVIAFSVSGRPLRAQVGATYYSLESMVAGADTVVRGTISGFRRIVKIPKNGRLPDGTTLPDGRVDYYITLNVDEVLRGKTPPAFTLVRETSAYDRRIDQWLGEKTEFLWFFNVADAEQGKHEFGIRYRQWRWLRLGSPVPEEESYNTVAPPIFSMDIRILRQRDELLEAARRASKIIKRSKFQPVRTMKIVIPRSVAHKCRPSGDVNLFVVPIVEPLEPIARRMIAAPGELDRDFSKPSFDPAQLRRSGVELLAHFKSDKNAALLKSLLDDPVFALYDQDEDGQPLGRTERRYVIRGKAYDTLRQWGVDIPKPVLREAHAGGTEKGGDSQ